MLGMNEYQKFAGETAYIHRNRASAIAIDPLQAEFYLRKLYPALKLNGEAGEIAEKVGKLYRDGCSEDQWEDHRRLIGKELGDVLWYIADLADEYGYTLEEIAQMNVDKLRSRRERGVVQGNGDER